MLGISKRGNTFVRTLLIHGARAVITHVEKKTGNRIPWIKNFSTAVINKISDQYDLPAISFFINTLQTGDT